MRHAFPLIVRMIGTVYFHLRFAVLHPEPLVCFIRTFTAEGALLACQQPGISKARLNVGSHPARINAGIHRTVFDAESLGSGVHLVRPEIVSDGGRAAAFSQRVTLLK